MFEKTRPPLDGVGAPCLREIRVLDQRHSPVQFSKRTLLTVQPLSLLSLTLYFYVYVYRRFFNAVQF